MYLSRIRVFYLLSMSHCDCSEDRQSTELSTIFVYLYEALQLANEWNGLMVLHK